MSIKSAPSTGEVTCVFCGESGYDLVGLKLHLQLFCEEYKKLEIK